MKGVSLKSWTLDYFQLGKQCSSETRNKGQDPAGTPSWQPSLSSHILEIPDTCSSAQKGNRFRLQEHKNLSQKSE